MLCSLMFGCTGHVSMSRAILFHTTQFHEPHHLICLFRKDKKPSPTFWEPKHRFSWCCVSSKRVYTLQRPAFIMCPSHAHTDTATGYMYFTHTDLNTQCTDPKWPYNCGRYSNEELVWVAFHLLPLFMVSEILQRIPGSPLCSLSGSALISGALAIRFALDGLQALCGAPGISGTQLGNYRSCPTVLLAIIQIHFIPTALFKVIPFYRWENGDADQPLFLLPLSHWLTRGRMWAQTCWLQGCPHHLMLCESREQPLSPTQGADRIYIRHECLFLKK